MATLFSFMGHSFGGQLFELFARETNLKKQSSVDISKVCLKFADLAMEFRIHQE